MRVFLSLFLAFSFLAGITATVAAIPGNIDSVDFGFGASVYPNGPALTESIHAATEMKMNWLAVEFDWAIAYPDRNLQPDLINLDYTMQLAAQNHLPVLLRLHHAPAWAMGTNGPSPELTYWFINNLILRYPAAVYAIELFPSPNTWFGWGTQPDAATYASLFNYVHTYLQQDHPGIILVTGGITWVNNPGEGIPGHIFLSSIYQAGIDTPSTIIGIQLNQLTGDPTDPPSSNQSLLRQYETLREVILNAGRTQDLLWITSLQSPNASADWVVAALDQLRSRLYVGAVFYSTLNPSTSSRQDPSIPHAILTSKGKSTSMMSSLKHFGLTSTRLYSDTGLSRPGVKYKLILKKFNRPPYP